MKKLLCLVLGLIIAVSFAGCTDIVKYKVPDSCCVVSVPGGTELWSNTAATLEKIDKPIKGMTRKRNRNYYAVTKNASFTLIDFEEYYEVSWGYGKVITGFDVSGTIMPYSALSGEDFTLTSDKNIDILPVWSDYATVGLIAFIADGDESLWNKIRDFRSCFNEDGSPKEIENFYYLLQFEKEFSTLPDYLNPFPYWETNMDYTAVMFTSDSVTYTINRFELTEGQQMAYCVLSRYEETNYFINGAVLGDEYPASLTGMTVDIVNGYKLVVSFEKSAQ